MVADVHIEYHVKEEVLDVNDVRGGISIQINGNHIAEIQEGEVPKFRREWKPEYAGEYIHSDFSRLIDRSTVLATGNVGIYDELEISFRPSRASIYAEPLTNDSLRISYRIRIPTDDSRPVVLASPESACGCVVDRCEFCQAVSDAAHEYVADLESMPIEWGLDLLDDFKELLVELDESLDTCAETPPE